MKPYRPYVYEEFEKELAARDEIVTTRRMECNSHAMVKDTVETVCPDGSQKVYINGKLSTHSMPAPTVDLTTIQNLRDSWERSLNPPSRHRFNQTTVLQQVDDLHKRLQDAYGPSESYMRAWVQVKDKAEILCDFYKESPDKAGLFDILNEKLTTIKARLKFFATTTNV